MKAYKLHEELQKDRTENIEISFPMPSSSYCQVCRSTFTKFQEHISSKLHLQKIRTNQANDFIHDMCRQIQQKNKKNGIPPKQKKIKKQPKA